MRALKEEIKEAILRPENEKQLMIHRLHQRISSIIENYCDRKTKRNTVKNINKSKS